MIVNTYLIMAIRLVGTASGFVFWMLAARMTTTEIVGITSAAVAATALLARIAQLGIGQTLVRYLPENTEPNYMVNSALTIVLAIAGLLTAVFLVGTVYWSPSQSILLSNGLTMVVFIILVLSSAIAGLLTWIFLARRCPIYSLARFCIQAVLSVLLVITILYFHHSYLALLIAFTLAVVMSTVVALQFLLPVAQPGFRFNIVIPDRRFANLSGYALSNFAADILRTMPHNLVPLLAVSLLGPSAGAILFVIWSLTMGLDGMAESAAPSFFAEGANDPANSHPYAWHAVRHALTVAVVFIIGIILCGQFVLTLFGPTYAADGYIPLIVLVTSLAPSVVVSIYLSMLRIRNRVSLLVAISALDVALGVTAVSMGMLVLGIVGASIGWLSSRIIVFGVIVVVRHETGSASPAPIA